MGQYWYLYVLPIIGGLILYGIIKAAVKAPGDVLQGKFLRLGTLKGKSLSEIKAACGSPSAVSAMAGGKKLCQWQSTGYHIALIFDENDICEGVSSEIKV